MEQNNQYIFDINLNQSVTENLKVLVLTFSLTSDLFNWIHVFNTICLTEEFNYSMTNEWTYRFGNLNEIVLIPVIYMEYVQEFQTYSSAYEIIYRRIYSKNSILLWLTDFSDMPTFTNQISLSFEMEFILPVVGAPSLNFIAKSTTNIANGIILIRSESPKLYKKLLWICNGKIIQGVVLVRLDTPTYFANYLNDTFSCFKFIASRSNNTVYCSSGLMSALYISHLHNFTLSIRDRTHPEQFTNLWGKGTEVEYFLTRTVGPSDPIQLPRDETRSEMFAAAHEAFPVYCERNILKKEPNADTLVWIVGFTPELWLQLVVMFFSLSFLYNKRTQTRNQIKVKEMEKILFVFLSSLTLQPAFQNNNKNGRLVALAIIWLASITDIMYGNSIVSIITVPPSAKILTSLPEALNLGYKFIWNPGYYFGATYEPFFRSEFKALGVY